MRLDHKDELDMVEIIDMAMLDIKAWMDQVCLKMNDSKTEFIDSQSAINLFLLFMFASRENIYLFRIYLLWWKQTTRKMHKSQDRW